MANYNAPTENIPSFNTLLFNQPEEILSQAEADLLYLSKTKTDTSTAPLTTFNGQLVANGSSNFNSSVLIKNRYKLCEMLDFSTDTTYTLTIPLSQTYTIRTLTPAVTSITINLPAITINDAGIIINLVKVKQGMNLNVIINSPTFIFALNDLNAGGTSNSTLLSVDKMMTTLMAGVSGSNTYWIELSSSSTWDRDQSNLIYPRLLAANTFTNSNTFNGQFVANGGVDIGSPSNFINMRWRMKIFDVNSPFTNFTQLYMLNGNEFVIGPNAIGDRVSVYIKDSVGTQINRLEIADAQITISNPLKVRQITSSSTAAAHTLFDNMIAGGTLTIGNSASTNTINGSSNFTSSLLSRSYLKLYEWGLQTANTLTLTFPMERTIALRTTSGTSMILNLPSVSANERGMIFTFIKFGTNFNVTINTTGGQFIYPLNNLTGSPTTNTTILSTDRVMTKLAVGWFGTTTYWIEVSDYSTFDRDYDNSIYPRLGQPNVFTNNNTFNLGATILDGQQFNTRLISSSNTTSATHQIFTNMVSPAVLTIGGATSINAIRGDTTFNQNAICNNRLNWGSTLYSFPFASNQSLGYYLKTTGTGTTLTTGITKSILTTASIPIGVWRIDWSVQNVVGASGAGTITQSQSFVSTTLDGNNTTVVPFTGSIVRSHVAEVYGNNDIQLITSSFTYQQSTAGVLYLNAFRVFSTGTYSFTGEVAITRLA